MTPRQKQSRLKEKQNHHGYRPMHLNFAPIFLGGKVTYAIYDWTGVSQEVLVVELRKRRRRPNDEHLRVFECVAYAHVSNRIRKKLDDKSDKCMFAGHERVQVVQLGNKKVDCQLWCHFLWTCCLGLVWWRRKTINSWFKTWRVVWRIYSAYHWFNFFSYISN